MTPIRVKLPHHLRNLAGVSEPEVALELPEGATHRDLLDALEAKYPTLAGTVRVHATGERRAYIRFLACQEDVSHLPLDTPLPEKVMSGEEPFWIIGAISGG